VKARVEEMMEIEIETEIENSRVVTRILRIQGLGGEEGGGE